MATSVPIWGFGDGSWEQEPQGAMRHKFTEKCAQHGVTRIISGQITREAVEAAHASGIEYHPYRHFNYQGGSREFEWSCDFVDHPVDSDEAQKVLDKHRPILYNPVTFEFASHSGTDFVSQHPEFWSKERETDGTPIPEKGLFLSLSFQEVRDYLSDSYVTVLDETGGDGLQMEFALPNLDEDGVETGGYEDVTAQAFEEQYGQSPLAIANNDPDWVQFRADLVTRFLAELRANLKSRYPNAPLTTTFSAIPGADEHEYTKRLYDWRAWVDQGIIDELYLWFSRRTDTKEIERQTGMFARAVDGRCPLSVGFSSYTPASFQYPDEMLEAGRAARASGAKTMGIYRGHSVAQLGLWPVLEQFGQM